MLFSTDCGSKFFSSSFIILSFEIKDPRPDQDGEDRGTTGIHAAEKPRLFSPDGESRRTLMTAAFARAAPE